MPPKVNRSRKKSPSKKRKARAGSKKTKVLPKESSSSSGERSDDAVSSDKASSLWWQGGGLQFQRRALSGTGNYTPENDRHAARQSSVLSSFADSTASPTRTESNGTGATVGGDGSRTASKHSSSGNESSASGSERSRSLEESPTKSVRSGSSDKIPSSNAAKGTGWTTTNRSDGSEDRTDQSGTEQNRPSSSPRVDGATGWTTTEQPSDGDGSGEEVDDTAGHHHLDDMLATLLHRNWYMRDVFTEALLGRQYGRRTSDIAIQVGRKTFHAHKFLLLHHSEVLGQQAYSVDDQLELAEDGDLRAETFETIFQWMYGGRVALNANESLDALLSAADLLGITGLVDECRMARSRARDARSAPAMFMHGQRSGEPRFTLAAYQMMKVGPYIAFNTSDFLRLPFDVVHSLFSDDDLLIESELKLLRAAVQWLTHDWDERLPHATTLINDIRFELMSVPQLLSVSHAGAPDSIARKTEAVLSIVSCRERLVQAYRDKLLLVDSCLDRSQTCAESPGESRLDDGENQTGLIRRISQSLSPLVGRRRVTSPGHGRSRGGAAIADEESHLLRIRNPLDEELSQQWETVWLEQQLNEEKSRANRLHAAFQSLRSMEFRLKTCEVELALESKQYLVHRFLLVYHNAKLARLTKKATHSHKMRVKIPNVPEEVFDVIYAWMYADEVVLNFDDREEALEVIKHFAVKTGFTDFASRCYLYASTSLNWSKRQMMLSDTEYDPTKSHESHQRGPGNCANSCDVRRGNAGRSYFHFNVCGELPPCRLSSPGDRTAAGGRVSELSDRQNGSSSGAKGHNSEDYRTPEGQGPSDGMSNDSGRGGNGADSEADTILNQSRMQQAFGEARRKLMEEEVAREGKSGSNYKEASVGVSGGESESDTIMNRSHMRQVFGEARQKLIAEERDTVKNKKRSESRAGKSLSNEDVTRTSLRDSSHEVGHDESGGRNSDSGSGDSESNSDGGSHSKSIVSRDRSVERCYRHHGNSTDETRSRRSGSENVRDPTERGSKVSRTNEPHSNTRRIRDKSEDSSPRSSASSSNAESIRTGRRFSGSSSSFEDSKKEEHRDSSVSTSADGSEKSSDRKRNREASEQRSLPTGNNFVPLKHYSRNEKKKRAKAATKIQSAYRGYKARRVMNRRLKAVGKIQKWRRNMKTQLRRKLAAVTIQSSYRGYAVRKKLKSGKLALKRIQNRAVLNRRNKEEKLSRKSAKEIESAGLISFDTCIVIGCHKNRKSADDSVSSPIMHMDINQWQWTSAGNLPWDCRKYAGAVCSETGEIVVAGGRIYLPPDGKLALRATASAVRGTSTDGWTRAAPMGYARVHHGTALADGVVYVAGGIDEHGRLMSSMESYRLNESGDQRWSVRKPMPEGRMGAACCALDGHVYLAGGIVETSEFAARKTVTDSVLVFSPENNSWSHAPPLLRPKAFANLVAHDGCLYLVGGATMSSEEAIRSEKFDLRALISSADVEVIDPRHEHQWRRETRLRTARHFAGATVIGNYLIVIGGAKLPRKSSLSRVELYDLRQKHWIRRIDGVPVPHLPIRMSGMCCLTWPGQQRASGVGRGADSDSSKTGRQSVHSISVTVDERIRDPRQSLSLRQVWTNEKHESATDEDNESEDEKGSSTSLVS